MPPKRKLLIEEDDFKRACFKKGVNNAFLAKILKSCLKARKKKGDGKGNTVTVIDYDVQLKALDLAMRLFGEMPGKDGTKKPSADEITALFGELRNLDEKPEEEEPAVEAH